MANARDSGQRIAFGAARRRPAPLPAVARLGVARRLVLVATRRRPGSRTGARSRGSRSGRPLFDPVRRQPGTAGQRTRTQRDF